MKTSLLLTLLLIVVVVTKAQNVGPPNCANQRTTPFCSCIGRPQSDYAVTSYTLGGVSGTVDYTFSFTGISNGVITSQEQVVSILRTTLFINGEQATATQIDLSEITTLPAGPGTVNFGYNDGGVFFNFLFPDYYPISPTLETFFQFQFFDQNNIQIACIRSIVYEGFPGGRSVSITPP